MTEEEVAEFRRSLVEWVSEGKPARQWCALPGNPKKTWVYKQIGEDPKFAAEMEAARERGADAIAQDSLDIIDTAPEFVRTQYGQSRDGAHVQWLKNRAYHRLQLLAKWHPAKYGDRLSHTGRDGGPIKHDVVTRVELVGLTSDDSADTSSE